jgi:phage gp46-like protein
MIKLAYNSASQTADLVRAAGGNIETDELLNTAVVISLFTRRRALPDDILPEPGGDRGGWWADSYPDVPGDLLGSRLWLLNRSKATQTVINQAKVYTIECLKWLVDDGIAAAVNVEVERQPDDRLAFRVEIVKPTNLATRWQGIWLAHLAQL